MVISTSTRRPGRTLLVRGHSGATPTTPKPHVITSSLRKLGRIILHKQPYVAPIVIPPSFACIHVFDQLAITLLLSDQPATTILISEEVC